LPSEIDLINSAAIILAAGSSSRMGRSKQMLDVAGQKLLVKTTRTVLKAAIENVTIVLGSEEHEHRQILAGLPVDIVNNPHWQKGMGSSIKTGLQHLVSKYPMLEAVILCVCDQPLLTSENISSLISKHKETGKPIIASRYSNIPGVPVFFQKAYFERLGLIPDDQGAKKIILENPADVVEVDFPEGKVDLDTGKDYEDFLGNRI
jgi:molybdenum cofactor cytidylyltransferase